MNVDEAMQYFSAVYSDKLKSALTQKQTQGQNRLYYVLYYIGYVS